MTPLSVSEVRFGGSPRTRRHIWAIGGGKGGIGKSLLAASVGWELARMGQQVVLVDADLGGANLHTRLGMPTPPRTLGDFLQGRCSSIEDVLTATPTLGLRLISGAADLLSAPDIDQLRKARMMSEIRALDADVVLIDLGAGTSANILDFFLLPTSRSCWWCPSPPRSRTGIASSSARSTGGCTRPRRRGPCGASWNPPWTRRAPSVSARPQT